MQPSGATVILRGRLYSTIGATLLAHDDCWESCNFQHPGRITLLFRTEDGEYLVQHQTAWKVDSNWLEAVSQPEAIRLYGELPVHELPFEEGFPGR